MKLLVVDDHPLMGETIDYIIKKQRPEIVYIGQALSGNKGIEMVEKNKPDILLVDIMMPGMDGLKMIQQIKGAYPYLKFVIITAFDDFSYIQKALRMGAVDYLLKPFKAESLLNTLDNICEEIQKKTVNEVSPYPALISPLYHKLSTQIQSGEQEQITGIFEEIWNELASLAKEDLSLIRTRSIEIAHAIIQLMDENHFCHEALTLTYSTFISKIAKVQTPNWIESCLLEFLLSSADFFKQYFGKEEYDQISKIKDIIDANLKNSITLDSIARMVYLNPSYLSRLFKKRTQMNFVDYVIDRRLERAKTLLLKTNYTVEAIALEIGYDKANSFRRLFKKKVNLSPSEYRGLNSIRNNTDKVSLYF